MYSPLGNILQYVHHDDQIGQRRTRNNIGIVDNRRDIGSTRFGRLIIQYRRRGKGPHANLLVPATRRKDGLTTLCECRNSTLQNQGQ